MRNSKNNKNYTNESENDSDSNQTGSAQPQTIVIEREKIVLNDRRGMNAKGCIFAGCGLFMAVIALIIFLIIAVPDYKDRALNYALSTFAKEYTPTDLPESTPNYIKPAFLSDITALSKSSKVVEQLRVPEAEFNSYISTYLKGKAEVRTDFKDRAVKIFIKSTDYKDSPWVKINLANPSNGQLQFESGTIGPISLNADSIRASLKNFKIGLEDFNFEKINEYLDTVLLPDSKYKIEKIDVSEEYALLRLIRK